MEMPPTIKWTGSCFFPSVMSEGNLIMLDQDWLAALGAVLVHDNYHANCFFQGFYVQVIADVIWFRGIGQRFQTLANLGQDSAGSLMAGYLRPKEKSRSFIHFLREAQYDGQGLGSQK